MRSLPLVLLLTGCAARGVTVEVGPKLRADPAVVAVAPALLLADIPGAVRDDAFIEGMHVGNVVFSGGYLLQDTELGPQVRSKEIELVAVDSYTAQVRGWVDAAISERLAREGVRQLPAPGLGAHAVAPPHRVDRRGSLRVDGRDNQNLPRFGLTPSALPPEAPVPSGADVVLVPIVVSYYSHNGGWFHGQTWGSGSGARLRLLWTLYDAETRAPLTWADIDGSQIEEGIYTPNRSEIEDILVDVERRVRRQLDKTLPL